PTAHTWREPSFLRRPASREPSFLRGTASREPSFLRGTASREPSFLRGTASREPSFLRRRLPADQGSSTRVHCPERRSTLERSPSRESLKARRVRPSLESVGSNARRAAARACVAVKS